VLICDFLVDERVQVENYSLQMYGQYMGCLTNSGLLGNICLLVAEIAFIVVNQFTENKSLERFS
jgi:hypothetical protein